MKRYLFPLLLLLMATPAAHSQEPDSVSHPFTLTGYGLYDFHYATDGIGGGALMLDWQVAPAFKLGIGAEYVSSNRIAAKLGGVATLLTTNNRCLTLENSYLWRHYPSLKMQEFTGALQVGWYARHVNLHLGLCNRYHAELVQRNNGGMGTVLEPMNVMFAAEGWWHNQLAPHQWNVVWPTGSSAPKPGTGCPRTPPSTPKWASIPSARSTSPPLTTAGSSTLEPSEPCNPTQTLHTYDNTKTYSRRHCPAACHLVQPP